MADPQLDDLPDELLLEVLSHVQDGPSTISDAATLSALLDVVPLVCRRWQRLSRERRLWERVGVALSRVKRDDERGGCVWREEDPRSPPSRLHLRALLHAPALGCVSLLWDAVRVSASPSAAAVAALSALRRSRATTREARVVDTGHLPDAATRPVLDFLWRSRHQLRRAAFRLPTRQHHDDGAPGSENTAFGSVPRTPPVSEDGKDDGDGPPPRCFFALLATLRRLERLTLHVHEDDLRHRPYAGQLAAATFPRLRILYLRNGLFDRLRDDFGQFFADLLRAAAPSLRELVTWEFPHCTAVQASLARCASLRSLGMLAASVPAVPAVPRLDTLRLWLMGDGVPRDGEDDGEAALDCLRGNAALRGLRELRVSLDSLTASHHLRVLEVAVAAATNLCVLHLGGGPLPVDAVLPLLSGLASSVRRVALSPWEYHSRDLVRLGVLDACSLDCSVSCPEGESLERRAARIAGLGRQARRANDRLRAALKQCELVVGQRAPSGVVVTGHTLEFVERLEKDLTAMLPASTIDDRSAPQRK